MIEYSLDEAEELLKGKTNMAKNSLQICEEDLLYLKEQITTMEVSNF